MVPREGLCEEQRSSWKKIKKTRWTIVMLECEHVLLLVVTTVTVTVTVISSLRFRHCSIDLYLLVEAAVSTGAELSKPVDFSTTTGIFRGPQFDQ
jgi:hypothetical protein